VGKIKTIFKKYILNNNEDSLKKRFVLGLFWSLFGSVGSKTLTMVSSILIARLLGSSIFGEYGMVSSTLSLFASFAGFGLGVTATKYISEYKNTDPTRTGKIIYISRIASIFSGLLVGAILFLLSQQISSTQLNAPHLLSSIQLSSVLLVVNTIGGVQVGILSGFQDFKGIARSTLFQNVISLPIFLLGSYYFGVIGLISGNLIIAIIALTINGILVKKNMHRFGIKPIRHELKDDTKVIWKFAVPSLFSTLMLSPVIWYGNLMLTNASGFSELGIFNAANQWKNLIMFIPIAIGNVILPIIVSLKSENAQLEKVNISLTWYVMVLMALPFLIFPEFFQFIYGSDYSSSGFLESLVIASLVTCILGYRQGIARKLASRSLMWWGVIDNLVWSFIFVLSVFLFRQYGALGLSLAYLVAYIINSIIFVPFYVHLGVVNRQYVISKTYSYIWIIVFGQSAVTLFCDSLLIRIILSSFSIILLVLIFRKDILLEIQKSEE
jgi:O-antigen/teichoic acid export membrane protein